MTTEGSKHRREIKATRELDKIMEGIREHMANPPDNCEYCHTALTEYGRVWNGRRWACYDCDEEHAQ